MALSSKLKSRLLDNYGPWALVTGASSGIGQELARGLAEAGLNLLVVARGEGALGTLAEEVAQAHGVEVKICAVDLSTETGVATLIQSGKDLPIGLLVASAGFGTSGNFIDNAVDTERNMLRLNCEGLMVLTHHFAGRFAAQKKGGIILLSSMVAFQGVPFAANYAATKAYVQSLAEGLAHELKPHGVSVLAAAPGPVSSSFGQRADMNMGSALRPAQVGKGILKALGRRTTVLPGTLTKLLVYSLRLLPRWGKVRVLKLVMGGMTSHQRT